MLTARHAVDPISNKPGCLFQVMEKMLHKESEAKAYAAGTRCLVLGIRGFRNCRDAVFLFSGLTSADAGAAVAYS